MFLLIYITHPSEAVAQQISTQLVREKLVACANCFPISSSYWWDGEVQSGGEWVSLLKTQVIHWENLQQRVLELHPYELPCIMRIEANANKAYEKWIIESTTVD